MTQPGALGLGLVLGVCFGSMITAIGWHVEQQPEASEPEVVVREVVVTPPPEIVEREVIKEIEVVVPLPEACDDYLQLSQEYADLSNKYFSQMNSAFNYVHGLDWRLLNDLNATHETEIGMYERLDKMSTRLNQVFELNEKIRLQQSACEAAFDE